ncbi:MAG: hypothetical protein HN855_08080 [Anaerolineae bacterium]|nr:hypothetical protein [Anaerolineae bacterium]MBT7325100.1 hypothetical protein [Anaerolineae bacterium]
MNFFTYTDLAGKRRLRSYVVIAIAVSTLLLLLAGGMVLWRANKFRTSELPRTPHLGALTEEATEEPSAPTVTPEPCTANTAEWSLLDMPLSQNYKRLSPACVYEGLERTVAWVLAIHEGYSRAEATQALGFGAIPMETQIGSIRVLTDRDGPLSIDLLTVPALPDLRQWSIDRSKNPATSLAMRGCFRTETIAGNERQGWGDSFDLICVVSQDTETAYGIMQLGENTYTGGDGSLSASRTFLFFGYGEGEWLWLGWRADGGRMSYADVGLDVDLAASDREMMSSLLGLPVWNAAWLEAVYGLDVQPLPDDWQAATDPVARDAILTTINGAQE